VNEAYLNCNFGGTVYDSGSSNESIKLSTTYGLLQSFISGPSGIICIYVPACSSGTPTCGVPSGADLVGEGNLLGIHAGELRKLGHRRSERMLRSLFRGKRTGPVHLG